MKRIFDVTTAAAGLVIFSPLMLLTAILIKLDSQGRVLFMQERVGRAFQRFYIYKFRTMVENAELRGTAITVGVDPRITRVGRLLRKTKIDELPQLVNVLKGEMSLVGPRPEVPRYVEMFREDYEGILQIRPGITDLASLKYQDEASILTDSPNPEDDYINFILPDKIKLAKEYARHSSFLFDVKVILHTLPKLVGLNARNSQHF